MRAPGDRRSALARAAIILWLSRPKQDAVAAPEQAGRPARNGLVRHVASRG